MNHSAARFARELYEAGFRDREQLKTPGIYYYNCQATDGSIFEVFCGAAYIRIVMLESGDGPPRCAYSRYDSKHHPEKPKTDFYLDKSKSREILSEAEVSERLSLLRMRIEIGSQPVSEAA